MIPHYGLFINGEWKKKEEKSPVINPSTGEVLAEISCASARDVDEAISAARSAFDSGVWSSLPLKERKKIILSIARGILDKAGDLARLESLNAGKPIKESTFMDIPSAAKVFEHFGNYFEEYSKEETIRVSPDIKGHLAREPRGVAVLIVPWNYPLLITSWKMAQALSAGNTVVLKPSSLTPLTALEMGKIIREAGVPDGVVNIITGEGNVVGNPLCGDPRVDMISFTGSNAVGRKIFEYSSSNIKKLILELGGKSASIILDDADIELAVNGSLCSIFLNQGQMCTAMSRIFVSQNIFSAFISDFTAKARKLKLGNAVDYETQMGPLISSRQREKVSSYVKQALSEGAQILCGGKIPADNSLRNGFFFEPTVLSNVSSDMAIFREEVFGPVVCIGQFSDPEEAVALANSSEFGLACSLWSKNTTQAGNIAARINAGTVWINTYGMFFNELPYGGFKQSGFGKELGKEGFLEYTRLKNIVSDDTQEAKPIVNYWYGF